MGNMSYCRFHNTAIDLQDCWDAMNSTQEMDDLSEMEKHAFIELVTLAKCIAEKFEDLEEHEIMTKLNRNELL